MRSVSASAPASIGNVCVGFDIMGQAFGAARDVVRATRIEQPGVRLVDVTGLVATLPEGPSNCAVAATHAVLDAASADFGVELSIHKGVPISSGMGGSAASAVAAAVATNALLAQPFSTHELLPFALEGERASSDPPPWDNVIASLFGGLVLAARTDPAMIIPLPLPSGLTTILFHPQRTIETRRARALLRGEVSLQLAIEHSRNVAAFVAGCAKSDVELIRTGMRDLLVEPQRLHLFPDLAAIHSAALHAGALGCSFSGAGPAIFAWALERDAAMVQQAMECAFGIAGIAARAYVALAGCPGARVLSEHEWLAA